MLAKVVADVLDDRLTFRDNNVFLGASRPNSDSRRLSKGMYGLQFRACTLVLIAFVNYDVVVEIQLFKQPDDALATRLVEPVGTLAGHEGSCKYFFFWIAMLLHQVGGVRACM
jgi:hypothetical protein